MFARTERLLLRPGWPEDADALTSAIAHEGVAMNLARLPWPYSRSDAIDWLTLDHRVPDLSFVVIAGERDTPRLIGGIGLHRQDEAQELGYWLTPNAWGRGYATEAGHAVVAIARDALRLDRLVSGHFVDNPASGRVLRKLGFRDVGEELRYCSARRREVRCMLFERKLA